MSEITISDLNNLKKKINSLQEFVINLEEKLIKSKDILSPYQIIFDSILKGKNSTKQMKTKEIPVTPLNDAANDLFKKNILKITSPGKKKITGAVTFELNFKTLIEKIFSKNQSFGSTLIIEEYYLWLEKNYRFKKEFCDDLLVYLKDNGIIKMKEGDPINYSGRHYVDNNGVKFFYLLKREF